jgi:large subunit ribosomal protein L17
MRHKKKTVTLDRKAGPRKAMLRTLCISVIQHGRIQTTPAKAKVVRSMVEKMVTMSKEKSVHTMRQLESKLGNKAAVMTLVNTLGPRYKERAGGYTRMTKVASRSGDNAEQVVLEFVTKE